MTGEPLRIYMDPNAKPVAVHNAASIPLHWHVHVKRDLERDVCLGVLEKVPVNTPSVWCSRMVVTGKANGKPRRTVDLQPQNRWSVQQSYPIEPQFLPREYHPISGSPWWILGIIQSHFIRMIRTIPVSPPHGVALDTRWHHRATELVEMGTITATMLS